MKLLLSTLLALVLLSPPDAYAGPATLCVSVDADALCSQLKAEPPRNQMAMFFAPAIDAAPPADARVDDGLTTSPSKEMPAVSIAGLPSPDADPAGVVKEIADASQKGQWRAVLALAVWLAILLARRFAARLWPYLATTRGGMYLAFGIAIASTVAVQLYAGKLDLTVIADGVLTALAAIGVHHTGKDAKAS